MRIFRNTIQGDIFTARDRLKFCLDKLEQANHFNHGVGLYTEIVDSLTIEEIMGALVAAEQSLKDI